MRADASKAANKAAKKAAKKAQHMKHDALKAARASVIAATDVGEALRLISRAVITAAIVDVKLGNDDCARVCRA